ncbi:MAG: IS21 family transposase [Planctomycetes bacterium]|nr:IS21 family transposase [Planctomycetota bacterium]
MNVALWAEIRRLSEIEHLSQRAIARRLGCCRRTVKRALAMDRPPHPPARAFRGSLLDPYLPRIEALLARCPELSAVRVLEEIRKGPDGYRGGISLVRRYVRKIRPPRGRVYQEVFYEPGEAMQVDWGACGRIKIGRTWRRVSVFVAVLCYSRLSYIEFSLAQRKADFYRALVHALEFFGGSPHKLIFDNLKAAVLNGSGRHACLHPEFLALCGHYCLEPIACARRDPESKGVVEAGVRYVKRNALQGRSEELTGWEDYRQLAVRWRDETANVRVHETTKQRPVDRFEQERSLLRPLPAVAFDTDEVVSAVVSPLLQIKFDANRYSVPPDVARQTVLVRATATQVRVFHQGREVACHARCYERGQRLRQEEHHLQALQRRSRPRARHVEQAWDALGETARAFHLQLRQRPVKTTVHLRRLLNLVQLYGREEVLAAVALAQQYQTYDAAYVETLLLQARRRRELPPPTPLRLQRPELIDEIELEDPDPGAYDQLYQTPEEEKPHE